MVIRMERILFALGDRLDADQRSAEVAIDVDGEGLERRDVEDANAALIAGVLLRSLALPAPRFRRWRLSRR